MVDRKKYVHEQHERTWFLQDSVFENYCSASWKNLKGSGRGKLILIFILNESFQICSNMSNCHLMCTACAHLCTKMKGVQCVIPQQKKLHCTAAKLEQSIGILSSYIFRIMKFSEKMQVAVFDRMGDTQSL